MNIEKLRKNKRKIILSACMLFSSISYCQVLLNMKYEGADGVPQNLEFHDASGQIIPIGDRTDINGSPLFNDKWGYGIIRLKNRIIISDSAIGYSLYNAGLFLKRNGTVFVIDYPVKEFSLEFPGDLNNNNNNKIYNFQNGFPAIEGYDSLTFYEVLYGGNSVSLLKLANKKVVEPYQYGVGGHREYILYQEYFAFLPKENKMIELGIKMGLNAIRKKLPGFAYQISIFPNKYDSKKEGDLIQLFSYLDTKNSLK